MFLLQKLDGFGDYSTYSTRNLSIGRVGHRLSIKWPSRQFVVKLKFVTNNVAICWKKFKMMLSVFLYYFCPPEEDCVMGAHEKCFCFQPALLYFLMFFLLTDVGFYWSFYLSVVVVCCWDVGWRLSSADCRLSGVTTVSDCCWTPDCRMLIVDCQCRVSVSFSIVGAQLGFKFYIIR